MTEILPFNSPVSLWQRLSRRASAACRLLLLTPREWGYLWAMRRSRLFDRAHYRAENSGLHPLYRLFPERHFLLYGEHEGRTPNPDFVPVAYARLNPDLGEAAQRPFLHYLRHGRGEQRLIRDFVALEASRAVPWPVIRAMDLPAEPAQVALHLHLHYRDLWSEFSERFQEIDFPFDLFVTLTARAEEDDLPAIIRASFPQARVWEVPNRGRDLCPFIHLNNAETFAPYRAVVKLHGKKSLHRVDGDLWRRHLVDGILPPGQAGAAVMRRFLADPAAGVMVADGQSYQGKPWWGSNRDGMARLLARIEMRLPEEDALRFPAGSIYWIKPEILDLLRGLSLDADAFDLEFAQVDGTVAHALERVIGTIVEAAGREIRQVSEPLPRPPARPKPPRLISAFYLPQFHPTPENDRFWGPGYTEWQAVARAQPRFFGHQQPVLPGELGFYDLRLPEVMGAQAALAADAGIGAFCVYHYWFDGRAVLERPMQALLDTPEVAFPFYLAWANESWSRNWDGLSGDVLIEQGYRPGFEAGFAASVAPFMRDPRYLRPDGTRPRLMIYRPEDLPEPELNITRLRAAFHDLGIGAVELGAVLFHLDRGRVAEDLVDFWVEMPPHGLVEESAYLIGGDTPRVAPVQPHPGFNGLIYDYEKVIAQSLNRERRARLPRNTIPGVMASWDNTARRGPAAHLAWGANPARFAHWVEATLRERGAEAYRGELFINAWNEWGEKAMLEPSQQWGRGWLRALSRVVKR